MGGDTDLSEEAVPAEVEDVEDTPIRTAVPQPIRTVRLRAMGCLSIRIHPQPIHIPIDAIGRRN